jgi:subfamily B ATP-binding cassette protein HlyB/CyaB
MSYTKVTIQEFLAQCFPFNQLSDFARAKVSNQCQLLRYRMGQTILTKATMPTTISILYEGQARLLGYEPHSQIPTTLQRLEPGAVLGMTSLIRAVACETVTAATEVVCLTIPLDEFSALLERESVFAEMCQAECSLVEVFDFLCTELDRRADRALILQSLNAATIGELAHQVLKGAIVKTTSKDQTQLSEEYLWWVSRGQQSGIIVQGSIRQETRLIGLPQSIFEPIIPTVPTCSTVALDEIEIPYGEEPQRVLDRKRSARQKYPFVRGQGLAESPLACFEMVSQYWNLPFRQEVVQRVLQSQLDRSSSVSLQLCGAIAELIGLNAKLVEMSVGDVSYLEPPALIQWQDRFAVVYEVSPQAILIGDPQIGIVRVKLAEFEQQWGEGGQLLLLEKTAETPQKQFGLGWFLPSLWRYRVVLFEVLVASFVAQLFGLANPLIIQLIIDKVIVQNSLDTLHILAVLLIVLAVFEGLFNSLRTYLFADTTNRIDLALGSSIIDHLLRLPLRYFEKRPVGDLASRANELENIRQFLTGTALTVVLDAIFSIVYIVAMFFYSWFLALVALVTVPLFMLLTLVVAPIVRRQLREKAERNAQTQSYLVEVLSGIQTVKAQNLELRSRWQWQERYTHYVNAGFKTVSTSTAAGTVNDFLNKLSGLLVLWAGVYLVLQGQMTLGQLIAFRIIAGYVTAPLLRLTQLWQNFQSTALSLERLGDILDTPAEANALDRQNIPMPLIEGAVCYEDVSFRFQSSGALQLDRVNLSLPAGRFVGVVGQSGSGKSTLTKLLSRLYEPTSGRVLIDGYDINKVELYSLRRQIGVVLQDSLLFDGTVRENIAVTHPDATPEEIVKAAKIAAAHDFIMTLPNGYNTRVGERGAGLSGGQRQRIAIARVVLQNPQLLILDEATSALDYQAERQVCLNLAEAFRERTIFFITHRLNTVRSADLILMLDQGAIVEQGTHDELISLRGRYFYLYQQQQTQF